MDRVSLLSLLIGTVLPLLVALVTKASWSEALKAVVLALFSALTGAGSAWLHPDHASGTTVLANAVTTFVTGAAVAAGTWRPTGVIATLEKLLIKDLPFTPRAAGAGGASSGTQPPAAS